MCSLLLLELQSWKSCSQKSLGVNPEEQCLWAINAEVSSLPVPILLPTLHTHTYSISHWVCGRKTSIFLSLLMVPAFLDHCGFLNDWVMASKSWFGYVVAIRIKNRIWKRSYKFSVTPWFPTCCAPSSICKISPLTGSQKQPKAITACFSKVQSDLHNARETPPSQSED